MNPPCLASVPGPTVNRGKMMSRAAVIVVLALVAACFADPIQQPRAAVISNAVRKALEALRPHLKDLAIPNQSMEVKDPKANLTVALNDGVAEKLEKFRICRLDTMLVPPTVTNLTLVFDEVKILGVYSAKGHATFPGVSDVISIDGKGNLKVELKRVFTTIAAKFVLSGKKVQIAPKGLYGFDIYIGESKFQLDNLCRGGERGENVNELLGQFFPDYVNSVKRPLFDKYRDTVINMLNEYLAGRSMDVADAEEIIDS